MKKLEKSEKKRTRKTAQVKFSLTNVTLNYQVFSIDVEYDTLVDLVESVEDLLQEIEGTEEFTNTPHNEIAICLPECDGGGCFLWDADAADDCFVEKIKDVDTLVKEIFSTPMESKCLAETKKTAKVTIDMSKRTHSISIEYDTLYDLSYSVNDLIWNMGYTERGAFGRNVLDSKGMPRLLAEHTVIMLPECDGGGSYRWDFYFAHSCFDHGKINVDRFVEMTFFNSSDPEEYVTATK
jgi:hypothetical protein